uniref:glycoside hydrolase family 9 protein n=1 Tax=Ningiella ruwaisensis TaxID=2364274 RepID=UPI00109FCF6B|nr:glycoside hydrolase family 9 protein [Ningiella ruwaisensis]
MKHRRHPRVIIVMLCLLSFNADLANAKAKSQANQQANQQANTQLNSPDIINIGEPVYSQHSSIPNFAQTGPAIVVDQFGYLPTARKIAVLREPVEGFDAKVDYQFSSQVLLKDANSHNTLMRLPVQKWNDGKADNSSGDLTWHIDFSALSEPGIYYLTDEEHGHRSYVFEVDEAVYKTILKSAFRVFYYQRAGFAKKPPFADKRWQDEASHLQDKEARLYSAAEDESTEKDLSGGWYDAGDYNKYTNWTADYIIGLLSAYIENPKAWTDDFNLPESGNGVPDILDEVDYGVKWLERMQNDDGSVLSIVSLDEASPPSKANGPSVYGPASTSASLTTANAFAFASLVYRQFASEITSKDNGKHAANTETGKYWSVRATKLEQSAINAWKWALAHPNVIFKNNDEATGSKGVGAGQQEVNEERRARKKLAAAIYLFALTDDAKYARIAIDLLDKTELIKHKGVNTFGADEVRDLLYFAQLEKTPSEVKQTILDAFTAGMKHDSHNLPAVEQFTDPYMAPLRSYTWGSSAFKANQGSLFYEIVLRNLPIETQMPAEQMALNYLHYMHGVNPLGKVYLSNMYEFGAENSVNEFYHAWFKDGSDKWEHALLSAAGPAPGFVVGGPNPSYRWDSCCPNNCRSEQNNKMCGTKLLSPPANAFPQKAYMDFNTSWPINSWEVTENSNKYQTNYLRLLSKFVN